MSHVYHCPNHGAQEVRFLGPTTATLDCGATNKYGSFSHRDAAGQTMPLSVFPVLHLHSGDNDHCLMGVPV